MCCRCERSAIWGWYIHGTIVLCLLELKASFLYALHDGRFVHGNGVFKGVGGDGGIEVGKGALMYGTGRACAVYACTG
jgi:hypothetical protein